MFPFHSKSLSGSWASSTITSAKVPPASSWWSLVVVKYMLPGTSCPGLIRVWLRMCSAALPWWVGMMYS
jgi:hypothetical protein